MVVNIGDSVVFGTRKNVNCEVTLSSIHNLQIEKEREDVIGRRGLILKTGGTYRVHGNLSLSRSIGDKNYKEFISSTPEVNIYENSFEKIILTSDGIFTGRSRKNI